MGDMTGWATLIAALAAAVVSVINAIRTPRAIEGIRAQVGVIKHEIDGRMTELLEVTRLAARAAGHDEGRAVEVAAAKEARDNAGNVVGS